MCGKELESAQNCQTCTPKLSDVKKVLEGAKQRAAKIENDLTAFREKIKKWRESDPSPIKQGLAEDQDINRCIHYLCLMADELEGKIASQATISQADAEELRQKALYVAKLAKELTTLSS